MWRVLRFVSLAGLVVLAAGLGAGAGAELSPSGPAASTTAAAAGFAGLALGVLYAWFRRVPWYRIADALRGWYGAAAQRIWWAALACVSVAVLVFY